MRGKPRQSLIAFLKRLDASQTTALVRYALNRVIDLFVIGPAAVLLFFAIASWASGTSPFRALAEGYAEAGEAFRGAPAGFVSETVMPELVRPDAIAPPLQPDEIAKLPKRLVAVEEFVNRMADQMFTLYVISITLGLLVLFVVRGWHFFTLPANPEPQPLH